MFKGVFKASIFFKVSSSFIIVTLFLIYFISQYLKHDKPFPQSWISDVGCHYPQFVFFRTATISGSVLVILGWFTNHFYLSSIANDKIINLNKYYPKIPLIIGTMGAMLLMGSTANMDTGIRNGKWHTFCASRFFILTLFAQIYNTVLCAILHSKGAAINTTNLYAKYILVISYVVQAYISINYGYDLWQPQDLQNNVGKFLQWTLTFCVVGMFYSIGYDCRKYQFIMQEVQKFE